MDKETFYVYSDVKEVITQFIDKDIYEFNDIYFIIYILGKKKYLKEQKEFIKYSQYEGISEFKIKIGDYDA